jgi:zinc protease
MASSSESPSRPSSLPGPDNIVRHELANGIVVLSRANPSSASFVVSGSLPAGGIFDPNEQLGLAGFTASALMRGTQDYTFLEIYEQIESIGASLGFSAGTHHVNFSGRALVEDFEQLLFFLAQALRKPVFPAEHVERLRAQLLTALAIRAQDTAEMASLAFDQIVYRDHPYSRPEDGYPETIQAIQPLDLAGFHKSHFGPQGMLISVVGGLDPASAIDSLGKIFEDWQNPEQVPSPDVPPVFPLPRRSSQHVQIPGKFQSDLIIGAAGPTRLSADYLPASLGNHVLGRFGMMGRLGKSLREDAGIAYYASSSLSGGLGPGPWEISAGVDPDNLEQAVDLVLAEIERFCVEPVGADELADSQANYTGRLPISFESNSGVASALITLERYQLGLDYYLRYPDLVNAVTPERILEVTPRYLDPGRLAIVTAGPGNEPAHERPGEDNEREAE